MAEKKFDPDKCILKEPWGRHGPVPGQKAPEGTPPEKPYWIGIAQEEPEEWDFPLSQVLRPIWGPRLMFEKGAHKHPVGEILYFIGGDPMNFDDFGAEVELMVDGEKYFINSTTWVYIPPDVPHCPLNFKKVDKPIMFGHIMFADKFEFEYA